MQKVQLKQDFHCDVSTLFGLFSDHIQAGEILKMPCQVIQLSNSEHPQGVGSIRKVKAGLLPAFEETITQFIPNELIEYQVTQGGIVKDHLGRLRFKQTNNGCQLNYEIAFNSRFSVPFLGKIIASTLQSDFKRCLQELADRLKSS